MDRYSEEQNESRVTEDRTFDARQAGIRKMLKMQYQDKLHIDPDSIPPNMEYMWVRESLFGDEAFSKMTERKRVGWTPVPATNHPEMIQEFEHGRKHHLDGFIHYSGLVLCQRPKEYGVIQRQMEHEASVANMLAIPGRDTGGMNGVKLQGRNEVSIATMQTFKD